MLSTNEKSPKHEKNNGCRKVKDNNTDSKRETQSRTLIREENDDVEDI